MIATLFELSCMGRPLPGNLIHAVRVRWRARLGGGLGFEAPKPTLDPVVLLLRWLLLVTHCCSRYTYSHGHRRSGYFRLRNWQTLTAPDEAGPFCKINAR
jgi:hypothetical protein